MDEPLVLAPGLHERIVDTVRSRFPVKCYGYLVSDLGPRLPTDVIFFDGNVRNDASWQPLFHAYGQYFVDHDDAGFAAPPDESLRIQTQLSSRGLVEVGVFHSHQRHPANLSQIDYELHLSRFDRLWHMIVSLRNPAFPQLRAFSVAPGHVRELDVVVSARQRLAREGDHRTSSLLLRTELADARVLLELDRHARPKCADSQAIVHALEVVATIGGPEATNELVIDAFLCDAAERYETHVAQDMCVIPESEFEMGTPEAKSAHFCGESPRHGVQLSRFAISRYAVTRQLFTVMDPRRSDAEQSTRSLPVTDVTWHDAFLFAAWMGCRLPTEAEWEYACGRGDPAEWACEDERELVRFAWYAENSGSELHTCGALEPNELGLFDLHGNVWEWCQDCYHQDWYSVSPRANPSGPSGDPRVPAAAHRVCRGGSALALAEMCRTRFRYHEPPGLWARDLGFRLAGPAKR